MSLSLTQVDDVLQLLNYCKNDCRDFVELAATLREQSQLLKKQAAGYSMATFLDNLPSKLRGLVEYSYDLADQPQMRILEEVFFEEFSVSRHEGLFLSSTPERERPFFMSSPRVGRENAYHLPLSFIDKRIDLLAATRTDGCDLEELIRILDVPNSDHNQFASFFQHTAPTARPLPQVENESVRMRFFGHACVLLQTQATSILIDPFFAVEEADDGRFTLLDLPQRIDYVILSHSHHDHFNFECLLQIRPRIDRIVIPRNNSGALCDPSMRLQLQKLGFSNVIEMNLLQSLPFSDGSVLSLPFSGEHADLNVYSKQALMIELRTRRFLLLVDSDGRSPELYSRLKGRIGPIDALFLGMECEGAPLSWLYEPLLTHPSTRRNSDSRRLSGANCERARAITEEILPGKVFIYALGQEPWMRFLMGLEYQPGSIQLQEVARFLHECEAHLHIPCEKLISGREIIWWN